MRLLVLLLVFFLVGCSSTVPVIIKINPGLIVGFEQGGINHFLGIPYGKPPVSELRWAAPAPVENWTGVKDTNAFGPWCPQVDFDRRDEGEIFSSEGITIFVDVPPSANSDEDCLSLNVLAPVIEPGGILNPVMVFIHGNALGSSYSLYDGKSFAGDGIVFVSINFRLLTLGNFAHPSITRATPNNEPLGNYSMLDQLEALKWVQENIAAFGGDPTNVTVVGSSAGASSILQMLTTKIAEGLFHKAIIQSGNGWWQPLNLEDHEKVGCLLTSVAGLDGCNATVEELRALPWQLFPTTGPYSIDGRMWQRGATEMIAAGEALDIPVLIGWNSFDGSSLRYSAQQVIENTHTDVLAIYEKEQYESTEDLAYSLYTDLHAAAPARWLAHQFEDGEPAFLYLFSYVLSTEPGDMRGAQHAYELPHVFDSWNEYLPFYIRKLFISKEDLQMTAIMHQCWVSFLKQGRPKCNNVPEWPEYRRESDQLMELNLEPRIRTGFRENQLNAQELALPIYLEQVKSGIEKIVLEGISIDYSN